MIDLDRLMLFRGYIVRRASAPLFHPFTPVEPSEAQSVTSRGSPTLHGSSSGDLPPSAKLPPNGSVSKGWKKVQMNLPELANQDTPDSDAVESQNASSKDTVVDGSPVPATSPDTDTMGRPRSASQRMTNLSKRFSE